MSKIDACVLNYEVHHLFSPRCNDNFLIFYPDGKAGGAQILRCQGIAVKCYGFTLGALVLSPSGFCNNRVEKC